jgi:hypothetical protein
MLTQREIDILKLLAQGHNDTQIAKKMAYMENTVRHYLSSIRQKLGYSKYTREDIGAMRVRLAIYAVSTGLYSPKPEQYSSPSRTHVIEMRHKHAAGNRVRIINKEHKLYKEYGIIKSLMPYTFKNPAYDVGFGDKTIAMSESSLEKA